MNKIVLSVAALAALSGTAFGQAFSITPNGSGNAASTNGYYDHTAPSAFFTSTSSVGNGAFRPINNAATTPNPDSLFSNFWAFRGNNDTREYNMAMGAAPLFSEQTISVTGGFIGSNGTVVGNNLGTLNTGGHNFTLRNTSTVAGSAYNFTSQPRYTITGGASGPTVMYTNTITNTGSSSLTLSIFLYQDFDLSGSTNNTLSYLPGIFAGQPGFLYNNTTAGTFLRAWANSPTNYAGERSAESAATSLRSQMNNTAVNNLNNLPALGGVAPVTGTSTDARNGFQWTFTLAAGESTTLSGGFGFVPTPGAAALLGLGGLMAARRRRA